jgi:molecular chaperone DnaK
MTASQTFTQKLYDAASQEAASAGGGAGQTSPGAGASQPNDDDVVDAEIVDEE